MNKLYIYLLCTLLTANLFGQEKKDVYVDKEGVMRWPNTTEVKGFGVNYTGPFAHAYRSSKKLGVNLKEAIDNDIYHFSRLGFDAYRVHVWDTEISDSLGNILENEHLELFDYLVAELKKRNINCLITPIAFWGNGWPEKDTYSPGFSHKYGKEACLTNAAAIKAQANYLAQFLNHKNKYTGIAYKNEPSIVAFEVSNEPHHAGTPEQVTAYISTMVESMKNTGCLKPILYNVSHSIELVDAYYNAGIDGGTFQWYPTNLVSEAELGGNLLPNADNYKIPFANNKAFKSHAKIVYEFDPADTHKAYIYPAMARSFRTAGIQWATQFAYDPTFLANKNTEYNTHYMNLSYTPHKALSLKICSEIFHEMPMYKSYGAFPENTTFDNVSISYDKDLVEYMSDEKFFYTNSTITSPKKVKQLKEIAGVGSSKLIDYEGTGAYFLDELETGVWRLEVQPDVLITKNPYGKNSLKKKVAEIIWNNWEMSVKLPQLGNDFTVKAVNENNQLSSTAEKHTFTVYPGTYILAKKGKKHKWTAESNFGAIKVGEYYAPKSEFENFTVVHTPKKEVFSDTSFTIEATLVNTTLPHSLKLIGYTNNQQKEYTLKHLKGYTYGVEIPKDDIGEGYFNYFIVADVNNTVITFPNAIKGKPSDWDFTSTEMYETRIIAPLSSITLFDASKDFEKLNKTWNTNVTLAPNFRTAKDALKINLDSIPTDLGNTVPNYALRYYFSNTLKTSNTTIGNYTQLEIIGNALVDTPQKIEIALVGNDGTAFGAIVEMTEKKGIYVVKLDTLRPTKLVTLPRPYPDFLPYYFSPTTVKTEIDWRKIESIQLATVEKHCQINIESIRLVYTTSSFSSL
ncbi:glycoside hydrolase family 5 protein [Flammeovirga kamogawensis]|uniref:Membrane or secreted protein n=1 Tax=Flammeovirga kamogawensis TaxID=373891 RepID=A0ABX8H0U9_9BACT|nr:hypothetical protein [Flammeovirga kamogawensis]MBB6462347.1 hypothetical protein [Flammeovirga kamogawensis]QWG09461.1 membrane or secreted protein [Flammeovirga kamogawensis]TRX64977.1 hypothetical protein EO216_20815 [Flammeovirga kamogawensis]